MRPARTLLGAVAAGVVAAAALVGCGSETHIPEALSNSPFTTSSVSVVQRGNADATIDTASVSFKLDNSGSLVSRLTIRSNAAVVTTISVRGTLYDPSHQLVGDLSGNAINVPARGTSAVMLTGPAPLGTIAAATFEVTVKPSPT